MDKKYICSFCGTESTNSHKMVTGNSAIDNHNISICDSCIKMMYNIINESDAEERQNTDDIKKPREIKEYLDKYIISQDKAKEQIAVALYEHQKQVKFNSLLNKDQEPIERGNILCVGQSGSGKTATFKAIAKYFDRPILLATVSELTTTGVVGADFSDIIVAAIKNCNGDIQKAEKSIIFLDEFDKLARRNHGMTSGKDVGGESVQQIMLKYLEGDKVMVQMGSKRNPFADNTVEFDTSDVLFVLAGAFEGLTSIIKSRINKKAIGFNSKEKQYTDDDYLEHVTTDDLVQFGIIPELIGRCPKIITYKQLTEDNLVDILTKPKNALVNQYKELFKMDNVNLHFTDDALRTIAQIAIKNKTNARGLRSILSQILDNIEYIIPERDNISDIIITDNIFEKFKNNETDEIVLLS